MKINFAMLDTLEAAGATAKVIIAVLRAQHQREEPRKVADKMRKRSESVRKDAESCGIPAEIVRLEVDVQFDQFWKAYPKRSGANPRAPARKVFQGFVKAGINGDDIIAGARAHAIAEPEKVGTQYIPQAVKWLRDRRWEDYLSSATSSAPAEINWDQVLTSYKQFGHWSRFAGPGPDSPACKAPPEMLEKYELRTQ